MIVSPRSPMAQAPSYWSDNFAGQNSSSRGGVHKPVWQPEFRFDEFHGTGWESRRLSLNWNGDQACLWITNPSVKEIATLAVFCHKWGTELHTADNRMSSGSGDIDVWIMLTQPGAGEELHRLFVEPARESTLWKHVTHTVVVAGVR